MIQRPELLPALLAAVDLWQLGRKHPEALEMYDALTGGNVSEKLQGMARSISLGNVDQIAEQIIILERRLSHLAAGHKWN